MSISITYKLKFIPQALKEWKKLDPSIQVQLKKKLKERLNNPHVPSSLHHGFDNHYKIKLRASGYRLVYEVIDGEICVIVIAVGKRNRNDVYKQALSRSKN
ncbi:MAG: type II toxin-antitoxin system RelE/ParE family toxin [Desulfuromonas sp.]|nr:type II toxin-antitoxin system RelE/ParE family toxin [Desulfuromonas sp.]